MKTLYALVGICMSLHTYAAVAETPAPVADNIPVYVNSTDDIVIPATESQGAAPDANVAIVPPTTNAFVVDPDADDDAEERAKAVVIRAMADIIADITPNPQNGEDRTGSPDAGDDAEERAKAVVIRAMADIIPDITPNSQNDEDRTGSPDADDDAEERAMAVIIRAMADVIPDTTPNPDNDEDRTGSVAEPRDGETE